MTNTPTPRPSINSDYALLDSGDMAKLEQVGRFTLVRPAPQAIWPPQRPAAEWKRAHAVYTRDASGGGQWEFDDRIGRREFDILYNSLSFQIKLTDFGHIGLFPEQTDNWDWLREKIRSRLAVSGRNLHVLNLFGYTGGSTLAASQAGAHVVHVDAAKGVVDWARKNAQLCRMDDRPIRWLVDDAVKLVKREVRRGHSYQGIILDPPSFGRGPKGEVFKIEKDLIPLLEECRSLLAKDALFLLYSCHTPGFTPVSMQNQLAAVLGGRKGQIESGEMTIAERGGRLLPSGVYARWSVDEAAS